MNLHQTGKTLLDESSPPCAVASALDSYSDTCAHVTGIAPDASFDAWAQDTFLDHGVAINPRAAAHCVRDYQRSLVFIRSVYAAIKALLSNNDSEPVEVLYAGCGPYATLLLPILAQLPAQRLTFQLLDIHPSALDAVQRLIKHFELGAYDIKTTVADASTYVCSPHPHLIVTETMQKALEQEPQFAVTRNLAPQLSAGGLFIPQRIDVDLRLTPASKPPALHHLLSLDPANLHMPSPVEIHIPQDMDITAMTGELLTSIQVFGHYRLDLDEADITLARPCQELSPPTAGTTYQVQFCEGKYPIFEITPINTLGHNRSTPV